MIASALRDWRQAQRHRDDLHPAWLAVGAPSSSFNGRSRDELPGQDLLEQLAKLDLRGDLGLAGLPEPDLTTVSGSFPAYILTRQDLLDSYSK